MPNTRPTYDLKLVKQKLRAGEFDIKPNAKSTAKDEFEWGTDDIVKCLLNLNSRHYVKDNGSNHFYKTEPHRHFPNTMMDYYKARGIYQGESVYTHFYVRNSDGCLVISSFKEL